MSIEGWLCKSHFWPSYGRHFENLLPFKLSSIPLSRISVEKGLGPPLELILFSPSRFSAKNLWKRKFRETFGRETDTFPQLSRSDSNILYTTHVAQIFLFELIIIIGYAGFNFISITLNDFIVGEHDIICITPDRTRKDTKISFVKIFSICSSKR